MQTKWFPTSVQVAKAKAMFTKGTKVPRQNLVQIPTFFMTPFKFCKFIFNTKMIVQKILEGGAAGIAYVGAVCGGAYGVGCPHIFEHLVAPTYRVFFFHWYPPKKLKYRKPRKPLGFRYFT